MTLIIPDRTISYLKKISAPSQPKPDFHILRATDIPAWYFLALYRAVGWDHYWYNKLNESEAEIAAFLGKPSLSLFTLIENGAPAGFFMLDEQEDNAELVYFGLTPNAIGSGLGGKLLDYAVATAWEKPIRSMTLETCTLDHPRALALYQSRGFEIYDTQFVKAIED